MSEFVMNSTVAQIAICCVRPSTGPTDIHNRLNSGVDEGRDKNMTSTAPRPDAWADLPPLTGSALLDPWRIRLRLELSGGLLPPAPREATAGEQAIWQVLVDRRQGWCREYTTGPYRLDFFHPSSRLAVEIDGSSHWGRVQAAKDLHRDEWHLYRGIETLRFSNDQVLRSLEAVLEDIDRAVSRRSAPHGESLVEVHQVMALQADEPVESEGFTAVLEAMEAEIESFTRGACVTVLPALGSSRRSLRNVLRLIR